MNEIRGSNVIRVLVFALALVAVFLAGCSTTKTLYYWGNYEESVYKAYSLKGGYSSQEELKKMEKDREKALSKELSLPPGWHTHLAYLYYHSGDLGRARRELETEKERFPESELFINRLLERLKQ